MTDFDSEPDQEKRIEKLRSELEKLGGGVSQHPELSADLEDPPFDRDKDLPRPPFG